MKKFFKFLLLLILIAVLSVSAIVIYEGHEMYQQAIAKTSIQEAVEKIQNSKNYIDEKQVPDDFAHAIVAVEDRRFYKHPGIDIISIGRAVVTDIKNMALVEGGSTITQQLAKNMYFSQEKKFARKVAEVFVAFDLEKQYSKEEILNLYLNVIYFGDGHYGLKEASYGYFNKAPNALSLYEITLLAGLPNAPSAYALSENEDLAIERQNMVIAAMQRNGYLTEEQVTSLKAKQPK